MIRISANFGNYNNYWPVAQGQNVDFSEQQLSNKSQREVITTWKYDEEGNIVYYTYDKETGEIISKTKYKNPCKDLIKPQ